VDESEVVVRVATEADAGFADAAAALIAAAARNHDVARRPPELLRAKIQAGQAVLALDGDELVGFGFWSLWQGGRFVSHSGLVVRADRRGIALGSRLKLALVASSRERHPDAVLMSLSSSPLVQAMNHALGFVRVPLDQLTTDPEFWRGCESCRNHSELCTHPGHCHCIGMILRPGEPA